MEEGDATAGGSGGGGAPGGGRGGSMCILSHASVLGNFNDYS